MKRIIYIALALMVCSACKRSFVDLLPQDQISGANFLKNEADFKQALTTVYVPLRALMNNDFYVAEMRSDNTYYQDYTSNRGTGYVERENIADFTNNSYNTYTNNVYYACYSGISRANLVIERLPDADIDTKAKNQIDGEAKFLRAFYYFKLVRYYGGVPLFLKEVKKAEDAFLLRSTAQEVYAQIIADAKDAINQLSGSIFPQDGHATRGAATMLLADVYMTNKNFPDAEKLLNSLLGMGYDLLPNYADVFRTSNKNSQESIFEVQYLQGLSIGQQSNFIYQFLPRSINTTIITGVKTDNSGIGGYNSPTKDIIDAYEAGDTRKDASIGIAEGTYNSSLLFTFTANKSIINYSAPTGKVGVPYIKKYLNPSLNPNNTDDNWPVYRYADALLLLAEALNEQGKSGDCLPYLNKVRSRAFGVGNGAIVTTDQTELRTIILKERRMELAFENHRWHDLVRTGNAVAVMHAFGAALKTQINYVPAGSFQVNTNMLLYPIPQAERDLNPPLTQNDGY